ncbi:hypothetical protein [Caulobacter sp. 17J65-9]|uniref:hypothetical protein n=1 Tax=Caulobacter sp. 17J65-9 TaxID=2709382 RepID=UPI0013CBB2C0|nr:hypothetical protein [Caulobacter sp. 17J65-9]NEX91181.1 hypothetical protein [Caulobacter sp. 17J65-9]
MQLQSLVTAWNALSMTEKMAAFTRYCGLVDEGRGNEAPHCIILQNIWQYGWPAAAVLVVDGDGFLRTAANMALAA